MKKVIAILLVLSMLFSLGACFDKPQEPASETIIIHDGDKRFEVQANFDKDLNIIKTYEQIYSGKKDYYIEGVYDAKTDGEKYFDQEGDCRAIWSKNFPKDFYVRWENLDNYKIVDDYWWGGETTPTEYECRLNEDSFRYNRHYWSAQNGYSSNYLIINNNRDRIMDVNVKFRAKISGGGQNAPDAIYLQLCDGKDDGKEVYAEKSGSITTTYRDYEFSMQPSMKAFGYESTTPQRCLYIRFYTKSFLIQQHFYYKDLHMTIVILPK